MKRQHLILRTKKVLISGITSLLLLSVTGQGWADTWTGAIDDFWSTNGNWLDGSAPTSADSVTFDAGDTGGTNFVDANFAITGLEYLVNGTHTTNLNSGIALQVDQYLRLGYQNTSNGVGTADGTLVLGSNSVLNVGTPTSRANLNLGWNASSNAASDATGMLNALDGTANLRLNDLNIGRSARGQSATGTLLWDQSGAIDATAIYLSRGAGAVGTIETPAGGTLRLGSATTPVGSLRIGWNDTTFAGAASGTLDLSVNNPTFEAVISNDLSLGDQYTSTGVGTADGTLVLGSNSVLNVGTPTSRANLNLGVNNSNNAASDATGVLNALDGTANLRLNDLNIGRSARGQSATGTLLWDQSGAIDATAIYLSRGAGAVGTIETPAGGTLRLGSATTPVGSLRIGWNDTTFAGAASGTLDLSVNNPTFEAVISNDLSLGDQYTSTGVGTADGTLVLGSNSVLNVGTPTSRANLNLGVNNSNNAASDATGVLNALDGTANLRLNDLNIGRSARGQSATGTLLWDQSGAIDATAIYLSRGAGAVGTIETPAGGTLRLGSATTPVGSLRIGWNDTTFAGAASGTLDLSVNNPTFEAVISNDLSLGRQYTSTGVGTADGTLVLGSNSVLNVGTPTSRANLNLGVNDSNNAASDATGVLNALDGTANLRLNDLNIGRSARGQSATGTLLWDQSGAIDATAIYLSRGAGAVGTIETPAGGTLRLGSATTPVGSLRIGWNDTTFAGAASGTLDLSVNNPTFEAVISNDLSLGRQYTSTGVGTADGTLVLGSNSVLNVGTPTSRANLSLGVNDSNNAASDATGVLNALDGTANLRLNDLNIGRSARGQSATGTLLWDQSGAIDATAIYLSRGAGAVGTIETPAGGTLRLGSATTPVGSLRIGWNDTTFAGAASGTLDLSVNNPTFEAVISNDLSLGRQYTSTGVGTADGTLVLGSNSVLNVGTPTSRANLSLGVNDSNNAASDATGVLNALDGTANLRLGELNIGRSSRGQSATGTFSMGDNVNVDVNAVNIGTGTNASGTVNLTGGLMTANTINLDKGAFNFTGGRLAVNTFNGTLTDQGGTLAPGVAPGTTSIAGSTTVNGDFNLFSAGTLEIELMGTNPGSEFDQLIVNGMVDLNADSGTGGILDLALDFAPSVGDSFTIVENDGTDLVSGTFHNLMEGATINEIFDSQVFNFVITYVGGSGNDIVLNVASASTVPVPPAVWLFGSGCIGILAIARRRNRVTSEVA